MVMRMTMPLVPPEYERYATTFQNQREVIGWPVWDTQTYTSGTTVSLQFFQRVSGDKSLCNMEAAGSFPAPKSFLVRAPRLYFKARPRSVALATATNPNTGLTDDLAQLLNDGWMRLVVGSKEYGLFPLWMIPSGGGPVGAIANAAGTGAGGVVDFATNGISDPRAVYSLAKPILIESQVNFLVELVWPAAKTLASGASLPVTVALDGDLIRPVQ